MVAITSEKGFFCLDHHVNCYIDDRLENILDVIKTSPTTRAYLLDKTYNKSTDDSGYTRVDSVEQFFHLEGL
jgi:hypothetical protein